MKELHFFIARKADGSAAFIQVQSYEDRLARSLEGLRRALVNGLITRPDVSYITIHKVLTDPGVFELVSVEKRDASNGFHPCYACETPAHERDNCSECGKPTCEKHRKPAKAWMKSWCLECSSVLS